jgi:hypothetical protein
MGKMAWRNVNGEEGLISASLQILPTILAFGKNVFLDISHIVAK